MEEELIINAENAVLGRLASFAAKKALQGNKIILVNVDRVIVVGNEKDILKRFAEEREKGGSSQKGPFFPKTTERIMKRTIRGMLPYKKGRGEKIYKDIRCYKSIPKEYEGKKMIKSAGNRTGVTLKKISGFLRGKNEG